MQSNKVPTGVLIYGSPQFIAAISPIVAEPGIWTVDATTSDAATVEKLARELNPRAAVIEMNHPEPRAGVTAGISVQKGFRWTTVILVFDNPDESLLKVAASIRTRGWSLVSASTMKSFGVKRVFNGAFTSHGLVDQAVAALATAKAEKTEKPADAQAEGNEEAA
jgi:hypothetical protein